MLKWANTPSKWAILHHLATSVCKVDLSFGTRLGAPDLSDDTGSDLHLLVFHTLMEHNLWFVSKLERPFQQVQMFLRVPDHAV